MHFSGLHFKPLLFIIVVLLLCVWQALAAQSFLKGGALEDTNNNTNSRMTASPELELAQSAALSTTTTTTPEFPEKSSDTDTQQDVTTTTAAEEARAKPPEKLPCYDNITVLVEHMDFKNPYTPETYILCPNTVYTIGSEMNRGERCCLDNQSPILSRSNTNIKCGDDGDPNNHCVLVGGSFQVLFSISNWLEDDEHFVVEGITFENAIFASVMLSNAGDITFRNCIFRVRKKKNWLCFAKSSTRGLFDGAQQTTNSLSIILIKKQNHTGFGPILSSYQPFLYGRRRERHRNLLRSAMHDMDIHQRVNFAMNEYVKLFQGERSSIFQIYEEEDSDVMVRNEERHLQSNVKYQTHRWDGVVFTGNKVSSHRNDDEDLGEVKAGIITVEKNHDIVEIRDCVFQDNVYSDTQKWVSY